jgi:hypothetical protein
MSARAGRLAGAIVMESRGEFYLVGNTKEPCDWARAGFEQPAEADDLQRAFIPLKPLGSVKIGLPCLLLNAGEQSPEGLAELLANRFLIRRNSSVSERLWRIAIGQMDQEKEVITRDVDASWLIHLPDQIWNIVRDTVLKCT